MKKFLWVIVILATLVIIVGVIYYMRQPVADVGPVTVHHAVKSDMATATPLSLVDMTGWKTYTNSQYGFEFQYPNDPQLLQDKPVGFIPGTCDPEASVICFAYGGDKFPNTNFGGEGLSVNIAKNSDGSVITSAQDCMNNIGMDTGETKTINNVSYHFSNNSDGAGGHVMDADDYSAFINGKCFDIRIQTNLISDSDFYQKAMTDQMSQQLSDTFNQMLSTFKFTH